MISNLHCPRTTSLFSHLSNLVVLLTASLRLSGPVQAQDSTLTRLVRQHRYEMTLTGKQFVGPGWDKLKQSIQKNQFVLVGEAHGTAQIPVFTAAVAQELKPAIFVAEIDSYAAQDLVRLTARSGPPTNLLSQHPMALSFYSWAAEYDLARTLQMQNVRLLGLDQVNFFTVGRFYAHLAEQTKSQAAKATLRRWAAVYQARDRATLKSATLDKMTMFAQSPAALDSLVASVQKESPAVRKMVEDYVASSKIYRASAGGHQQRVNLMKFNLLQQLRPYQVRAGQPLPKMLFKFGANHMTRNLSFSGVFDLGSLALNLADAQNQTSLHVMIVGKQGSTTAGFNPDNPATNVVPYKPEAGDPSHLFYDLTGSSWSLFDLRPARRALLSHKLQIASQELETIILGYDYLVIIPETTGSLSY